MPQIKSLCLMGYIHIPQSLSTLCFLPGAMPSGGYGLDGDQLSSIPRSGTEQDVTVDSNLTPDVETGGQDIGWHVHVQCTMRT